MAYQTTTGEEAAARKQGAYGDAPSQPQESPYTDFKNTEEYVKEGYGGEGYEPKEAPKLDHQPDCYSAEPTPPAASKGHEGGGMKEKVKEKLAPCLGHSSGPDADVDAAPALPSPPKKGLLEKVKEKISPH